MKNIKILILVLVCLFIVNVKADMGAPYVISHKVKVTNKNGAACYVEGKKTGEVIPYGTTLDLFDDIDGSYIYVNTDKYSCSIKYSDISAVNQNFSLKNEEVNKLYTAKKAIVLAKGGLNMRKGPSVSYGRIVTVPQYSVVSLTYSAGTYWYYTTYNGKSGWITGMDGYLGYDGKEVLVSYEAVKIYGANGKTVLGTIPANTEIDEYIELSGTPYSDNYYYVIYNGIKGYVKQTMWYKTDGTGIIKLTKDYTLYEENGNPTKKLTAGQEFEYNMMYDYGGGGIPGFYIPSKKTVIYPENFEYVKEAKIITKTKGYLGEGLYGEAKTKQDDEPIVVEEEPKEVTEDDKPVIVEEKKDITNIIIIGLLAGIFACLTALVIIKLINSKKKASVVKEKPMFEPVKKEETVKVTDKEIAEAREKIIKEMQEEHKLQEKEDNKEE